MEIFLTVVVCFVCTWLWSSDFDRKKKREEEYRIWFVKQIQQARLDGAEEAKRNSS